jgi:hypothetical protein
LLLVTVVLPFPLSLPVALAAHRHLMVKMLQVVAVDLLQMQILLSLVQLEVLPVVVEVLKLHIELMEQQVRVDIKVVTV